MIITSRCDMRDACSRGAPGIVPVPEAADDPPLTERSVQDASRAQGRALPQETAGPDAAAQSSQG